MKSNKTKGKKTTTISGKWTKKCKGVQLTPWGTYRARITVNGTTYSKCFTRLKDAKMYYNAVKTTVI